MVAPFMIQASSPRTERRRDPGDESLCDALQTVFVSNTELAMIVWNGIYIPLDYKYDISIIATDVIDLIEKFRDLQNGDLAVHWPSNTFSATWQMHWDKAILKIHSEWHCVVGATEALLTDRPDMEVFIEDFIAEWKRPLQFAESALTEAGYDVAQLPGLERMRALLAKCPRSGLLYQHQA